MCGIVGAIAQRDVVPILVEGLRRLEYRGYDSAGVAVQNAQGKLDRRRTVGKVKMLAAAIEKQPLSGQRGIAHTRWATHGGVFEKNAHPHFSEEGIALVHNGIIENYEELRVELKARGYQFHSDTDSEVVAHLIHEHIKGGADLLAAVQQVIKRLHGAYAIVVMSRHDPKRLIAARMGCPVVVGHGNGENFIASDVQALLPVTRSFQFLEDGDVAEISCAGIRLLDVAGRTVERKLHESALSADAVELGSINITCKKRSSSNRARLPIRCPNAPRTAKCWMPRWAEGGRPAAENTQRAYRCLRDELSRRHDRALLF